MTYLHLGSECLFSRFGFNDGDVPDAFLDYCDEHQLPYPEKDEWHQLLADLVDARLVPLLTPEVLTYSIGTNHNPIRAERVGNVDVDWSTNEAAAAGHTFAAVCVEIPYRAVEDYITGMRA